MVTLTMKNNFNPTPPSFGLIGHRGVAALAPENTQASFELASKQGIEWVEFDVRLTKDHELVIFHDDTLERTTNGAGFVHEHTLEQLKALDAGSWFHPHFQDQTIPVFKEMIPEFHRLKLFTNIELKVPENASNEHKITLVNELSKNLLQYWPKEKPWPLVSSFDWNLLEQLRRKLPQIPIGFLHETCSIEMIELVANTPNSALHCDYQSLDASLLTLCQDKAIPVLAYTVNQPEIARQLLDVGLYGLFCDNPLQIRPLLSP